METVSRALRMCAREGTIALMRTTTGCPINATMIGTEMASLTTMTCFQTTPRVGIWMPMALETTAMGALCKQEPAGSTVLGARIRTATAPPIRMGAGPWRTEPMRSPTIPPNPGTPMGMVWRPCGSLAQRPVGMVGQR